MSIARRRTQRIPTKLGIQWHRGHSIIEAVAGDINEQGMFVKTDLACQPDEMLPVTVLLPDGPLKMIVVARFVGTTTSGRGVGAEIFVIGEAERERWTAHYWNLVRKREAHLGDRSADAVEAA